METILQLNDVEKHYGPVQVLRQCRLQIQAGEIYGLLGVNGAGKTTLMKLILGLQKLDGGSIFVLGREIRDGPAYLAQVGSILETPSFYEHLTAQELLAMHLAYLGRTGDIAGTLERVGLGGETRPIRQFSLGMRQRLGLARAILHRPRLLLLDEPLNGLDPVAILDMRGLLGALLLVCCTANGIPCAPRYILWVMLGMAGAFLLAAAPLYRVLLRGIERMEV